MTTYNKVVYGNQTLLDLTSDTVTAENLVDGITAHDASGEIITGKLNPDDYAKRGGTLLWPEMSNLGKVFLAKQDTAEIEKIHNYMLFAIKAKGKDTLILGVRYLGENGYYCIRGIGGFPYKGDAYDTIVTSSVYISLNGTTITVQSVIQIDHYVRSNSNHHGDLQELTIEAIYGLV